MAIILRQVGGVDQKAAATGTSTTPGATLPNIPQFGSLLVSCVSSANATTAANGYSKLTAVTYGSSIFGLFWKVVGFPAEAALQSPCTVVSVAWNASVAEFSGFTDTPTLEFEAGDVSSSAISYTSNTIDPADGVERLMVGAAVCNAIGKTWGTQLVLAAAATELTDSAAAGVAAGCQTLFYLVVPSTAAGTYTTGATESPAVAATGGVHIASFMGLTMPAGNDDMMMHSQAQGALNAW